MPVTVFTGPDPDASLTALLGRTPLRNGPVCAVVPDSRSVSAFELRLAEALGGAFTGHRVFTLEGLAKEVLSLGDAVPETIEPHMRRALVAEIAVTRIGARSRYTGLAASPGFAGILGSWLEDVRSGDASSSDRELTSAAITYETQLRRLGMTDHEGLIFLALGSGFAERFGTEAGGTFILHGFSDLTAIQARFLERIMAVARRSAITLTYDPARPGLFTLPGRLLERFRERGARIVEVPSRFAPGTGVVLRGFRSGTYTGEIEPGTVGVHTFRNAESEAAWVAGTIRAAITSGEWLPDEVMVVSRFRQGFGSPLAIAFRRNGIPVEGGIPRPLASHPVARIILRAIEASVYPDREDLLREVRRSPYTGSAESRRDPDLDRREWNCMVESGSPGDFVQSVRQMLGILRVRDRLDGAGDPDRAASEQLAYARFGELLDDFCTVYTKLRQNMHSVEFERIFRRFIEDVMIPDSPSPGGGVLLTDGNQARHVSRPVVFMTGADGDAFPMRAGGFSLHDPKAASLRKEHAESEEPLLFYSAMQGARQLFFTFPGIDDEGRDSTLSPYVREICNANSAWIKTVFHHGVTGDAWQGGCSTPRGRAESALRELKADVRCAPGILAGFDAGDPVLSVLLRRSLAAYIDLTTDRGAAVSSPHALEIFRREWGASRIFSVTELERYSACPLRYFFERVLGLAVDRETPGELDPADRGTIIHEILSRFYRGRIAGGNPGFGRESLDSCRRNMHEVCRTVLSEHPEAFRGIHPVVAEAEKRFLGAWMDSFLEREVEYFGREAFRPAFLEVDFGRARGDGEAYPPLRLGEGDGAFLLGGRIDRLDTSRTGEIPVVRVIDYKTGERRASLRDLEAGRDLQLALYLKAATESILPGSEINDGVFYNLRELEFSAYKRNRSPLSGEDWDEYIALAVERAADVAAGIRGGRFPAGECAPNDHCDFRPLCRGGYDASGEDADADS